MTEGGAGSVAIGRERDLVIVLDIYNRTMRPRCAPPGPGVLEARHPRHRHAYRDA